MNDLVEPIPGVHRDRHPNRTRGYLLYLTAATAFALNGTVSKTLLLSGLDSARLSQIRVTGAFLILFIFVAATNRHALRIRRKEIIPLLVYGVLGVAMTQYLYFVALEYLSVGVALLIEFTAPIMVALWFRFGYREPTRKTVWLALAISLLGLALVAEVRQGFTLAPIGVAAAFGAAIALAIYFLMGERIVHAQPPRDAVSLTMWGFGAASLFWAIAAPWWSYPWSSLEGDAVPLGTFELVAPIWTLTLWMILLGTMIPFWLTIVSLHHLKASQASTIGLVEPLLAIAFAWILLGETMTAIQMIGGALILGGVVLAERSR